RPFDRLPRSRQLHLIVLVGDFDATRAKHPQRARRALAAVDARRSEEHDRVLDALFLEAPQRFEILGENPDRARFRAFEKLGKQVRKRLLRHTTATLSDVMMAADWSSV